MRKFSFFAMMLTMIGVGLFFKPTNSQATQAQTQQHNTHSVLTFANFRDIRDLNPHLYSGELYAQNILFESLIHIDNDGSFKPWLAKSWAISEDGTTYTFTLRDDVSFHDGEKFNAQAAKANFDAILSNVQRHGWLESVRLMDAVNQKGGEAIKVTGEYELTIKMAEAYYPFMVELGVIRPFRFISPKAFINGTTKEGVSALSGTGSYVLKENHKDQYAVFEVNPNYWGEKTSIERIVVKVIPDNQTRTMALEKGEIDLIFGTNMIDAQAYNRFSTMKGFKSIMSKPLSTRMLLINTDDPITGDLSVRRALQHATDKATISKAIFDGIESPAPTLFAPSVPYSDIGLVPYAFDYAKAEALLEDAGWVKNGEYRAKGDQALDVKFYYNSNNVVDKTIAEFMQGEMRKIGMKLDIIGEEEQANRDRMKAGKFQIIFNISWGTPYDPHSFLGAMRKAGVYGDYYAQLGIADKALIDDTILAALESTHEAKRQEHYRFVLTRLHEEAVYLPLTYEGNRAIFNDKVQNVNFNISKYEVPFTKMSLR